jgi:hypothetical protein
MIHMHYLFRFAENNLWRVRDQLPGLPTHIELIYQRMMPVGESH